jgi:hypothetical protein
VDRIYPGNSAVGRVGDSPSGQVKTSLDDRFIKAGFCVKVIDWKIGFLEFCSGHLSGSWELPERFTHRMTKEAL